MSKCRSACTVITQRNIWTSIFSSWHRKDYSNFCRIIILNFYNDLDNVFAMPSSFFLGREGLFVRCKWCRAFLRGGGGGGGGGN